MKAVCKKEEFGKILDIAVRIASRHHTLPILSTLRIEAKDGALEVRATNLEIGLIASCTATVEEVGVVAVPAQTLLQTVSLIPGATLTLKSEEGVLCVDSERSKSRLKTLPPDDFPTIAAVEGVSVTLSGKELALGIKSVAFAASQSSIKPELGAVYIYQRTQHTLTLVATDSFRLAEKTIGADKVVFDHGILIPQKNALEIARIIEVLNESLTIIISNNQIGVVFESGTQIVSRLIEGTFPDYAQIIPKEYQAYATFLLRDFEHGLRKTNIFANKFQQVGVVLSSEDHTLTLKSENNDAGMTEETLHADINGSSLTLSFNQQYLVESIPHITSDSVDASFGGIGRPLIITGHEDVNFRYLVMPMNK